MFGPPEGSALEPNGIRTKQSGESEDMTALDQIVLRFPEASPQAETEGDSTVETVKHPPGSLSGRRPKLGRDADGEISDVCNDFLGGRFNIQSGCILGHNESVLNRQLALLFSKC